MVRNISVNAPGISTVTYARQLSSDTAATTDKINSALSSGGESDYYYDRTPDTTTYLQSRNSIALNQTHITTSSVVDSKAKAQIQGLNLMLSVSAQLGQKLTSIRNGANIVDGTFVAWCSDQLTLIGRELNHSTPDGNFAFASLTNNIPPVDPTKFTALPSGSASDTSYLVGAFGVVTNSNLPPTTVHAGSTGIESLIRTLRMCQSGDVNNPNDAVWTGCQDLLNKTVIPNLSIDLKTAGELSKAAQDTQDNLKARINQLSEIGQKAGFQTPMDMTQQSKELGFLAKMQGYAYFTMTKLAEEIQAQLDKLNF